jgi:hypothetical protein
MSRSWPIALAVCLLSAPLPLCAQDDDVSLGDLARSVRKSKPAESQPEVIDNDNMAIMMDKAEAERLDGKPVFSIDPSGKAFRMTSPDGTCSLSFDAKAAALITSPYIASDFPQYELAKLEGAAAVHDGVLEVTLHNGTDWELKEIVVGVTLLNQPAAALQPARLITATDVQPDSKPPDLTTIYHMKTAAPADSTKIFRAVVSDDLIQAKDWHWALVSARGVPPAAPTLAGVQPAATPAQQSMTPVPPSPTPVIQDGTIAGDHQPTAPTNPSQPSSGPSVPSSDPVTR